MKKKLSLLIFFTLISSPSFGQYAGGISNGEKANCVSTAKKLCAEPNRGPIQELRTSEGFKFAIETVQTAADEQSAVPRLAIRYSFLNDNRMKKIDLVEGFQFLLTDEFHNQYHQLLNPPISFMPDKVTASNFPSIYPGQGVEETIFFEGPVGTSKILKLTVQSPELGLLQPVILEFPTAKILIKDQRAEESARISEENLVEESQTIGPLTIIEPLEGISVVPGETVYVEVEIPEESIAPISIFVIIPSFMFKDENLTYHYEITVPSNQTEFFPIVVIGKWIDEQGEEEILSDSVLVHITPNDSKISKHDSRISNF